jgi:signal transduction histidine kinase
MIKADNSQLEQIFTNLIINAQDALKGVKAPDREKTIVIETGRSSLDEKAASAKGLAKVGEYVYISVTDNGCGIPEELCPRIFEPFFTTKAKNEGTGLGLSTVYGIVKQNQGSILVFSKPHSGTQFIIYWPVTSKHTS